jgi:hypothetical protein
MQLFNGRQAEHLVRFRAYYNAALGRNAVQMEFMKQLLRQALTREAIMRDPLAIANFVLNDIRHNVGADIIKYLPYVGDIKPENITTYVMPANLQKISGAEYVVADETRLPDVVREVFFASNGVLPHEPVESRPSHGLRIQVLNGSRVSGLGSDFADKLTRDGYLIVSTNAFTGTHENNTRIIVREAGRGADLTEYFKNAEISVDTGMPEEYDIVIVLGRGEG